MDNSPDFSKRYWLFAWWEYEARGGMEDFVASFDTPQEAIDSYELSSASYDVATIWDSNLKKDAMILHMVKGWITLE
jgi:hypothetical protein